MMGQEETIRLLQECDAGVQMGIASIQSEGQKDWDQAEPGGSVGGFSGGNNSS